MENTCITKSVRLYNYADMPCVCYKGGLLVPVTGLTSAKGLTHVELQTFPDGRVTVNGEAHWTLMTREELKAKVAEQNTAALVQAVKAHATANYNHGGWDYVVECWSDEDIAEVLREHKCKGKATAIAAIGSRVKVLDGVRRDVQAEAF
jgi:hypothetical protein